jgi:tetratricopeptide (TPR) repeat protein
MFAWFAEATMDATADTLQQRVAQAKQAYAARDFGRARPLLEAIVETEQNYADVYNMLGVVYHDTGLFSKAQVALERALALNPRYIEAALNLSVLFNDLGKYKEAHATYERALAACQAALKAEPGAPPRSDRVPADPYVAGKLANMHADLGEAYRQAGKLVQACAEYDKALELGPQFSDLRTKLALLRMEMQQPQLALQELERTLAHDPKYVLARLHLGICCYVLGRYDDAKRHWQAILEQQPEHPSAAMYLRLAARQTGP